MAFSDTQTRQLKAKLDAQHIKTRKVDNTTLHYIEGWHAIAEANRIFGYDAWDRRTLTARCVWTSTTGQRFHAAYVAKVRVRVRAGDIVITREGSGTGEASALTPGQAHDIALKTAETDATKRALTTFGNAFGLALYDPEQTRVRRRELKDKVSPSGPWPLHAADGALKESFATIEGFAEALKRDLTSATYIENLFAVWERNVSTVRDLGRSLQTRPGKDDMPKALVAHFKDCARSHGKQPQESVAAETQSTTAEKTKIDKSVLTISEPKRVRSKEHLRYVASQPCLICGRSPTHAHHIRFAQPRGLAIKVSDEFTVPLCAIHHSENHRTGNESKWWEEHKIEPLSIAHRLWQEFRKSDRNIADESPRDPT